MKNQFISRRSATDVNLLTLLSYLCVGGREVTGQGDNLRFELHSIDTKVTTLLPEEKCQKGITLVTCRQEDKKKNEFNDRVV